MPSRAAWLLLGAALLPGMQGNTARAAEPTFDPGFVRLSEILGSLHFLTSLCGSPQGDWRGEMDKLLDAENPDPERRKLFVAGFNRGYNSFSQSYRSCTPSARAAIDLYRREGEDLARNLVSRFGN